MASKIRLSVPLSEEVYKRIEEEASLRGVSMPTYVAFVLGDHFAKMDKERADWLAIYQHTVDDMSPNEIASDLASLKRRMK